MARARLKLARIEIKLTTIPYKKTQKFGRSLDSQWIKKIQSLESKL